MGMTPRDSGFTLRLRAAAIALGLVSLATAAGLLWIPLGLYDEPLLLVGGRIARAGGLPYLDFYTHYGPLGYDLVRPFLAVGNAGTGYRVAQALFLALAAIPLLWLAARLSRGAVTAAAAATFCLLNFSTAMVYPHFFAFGLLLTGLGLVALANLEPRPPREELWWLAGGAAVGLAGLVRPAFAAYGAAAVVGLAGVLHESGRRRRITAFLAGAVGAAGVVWLLRYGRIPITEAWIATVVLPSRLMSAGGRFLAPAPLPPWFGSAAQTAASAALLACLFLLAISGSLAGGSRRAHAIAIPAALAAAATPFLLRATAQPGRLAAPVVAVLFAAAIGCFWMAGSELKQNAAGRVSALAGLAAIAFLHYYLSRADQAHVTAAFALAAAAGAATMARPGRPLRFAIAGLVALSIVPFGMGAPPYPVYWIGRPPGPLQLVSTARGVWARFPASMFPVEAVAAVARADEAADPSSRFVAAASDHSRTDGSAVVLFLLSRRLPYTHWYEYDPGVQSTPLVQQRMIEELRQSGSATAVVWRSESFGGVPAGHQPRTSLDQELRRFYPRVAETFGVLELREGP